MPSPTKSPGKGQNASPIRSPAKTGHAQSAATIALTTSPKINNQVDLAHAYPSLYGAPSYASIFSEPVDFEPGPGQYDVPGSIGQQAQSKDETFPSVSILAKHASSWSKVYISKQHAIKARDTPGPGSYLPQIQPSESSVRFGTAVRKEISYATPSPGPVYDIRRSASDSNFGAGKFNMDDRWRGHTEFGATGPGQYNLEASFDGTKGLSKTFATGHRAYDKVRFPGCDRVNLGRTSPGPGQFRNWQPSARRCAFPRSLRKPLYDSGSVEASVGPGSYTIDSVLRKTSHGFGKPSVSARLSWKKNSITMSNWCRLGMAYRERS
ncbi:unnamed protein product [Amoebophrya sp. A120]|nr:unnamed protein product [Amoebophrya sp. A120]|eukprot:GSA120T00023304001.1